MDACPRIRFLFAFIQKDWSPALKESVGSAFQMALTMSNKIKDAVKNTAGQTVVNGLYLLDQPSMTDAMNSIPGMGMTTVDQNRESGSGTATSINGEFFAAILGGLSGNVEPMMEYLNTSMGTSRRKRAKAPLPTISAW